MGKEDFTKVTTESILLEELGPARSASVYTTSDTGDKKDVEKKVDAPPAGLGNFFVSARTLDRLKSIKLTDYSVSSSMEHPTTGL